MLNIHTNEDVEDIEDLMLSDNLDGCQNKKYVLPRTIRHKTVRVQRTCADSIIPGINTVISCNQCNVYYLAITCYV